MKITQTISPVHPGRVLRRELDARELTSEQAAAETGLSAAEVQGVLKGTAPVTPALTDALARAFLSAPTWLALQRQFDDHPRTTHGGARAGAGRPPSGLVTQQMRITGTPEQLAEIRAWLGEQGRGNGARVAADALHRAAQHRLSSS